MADKTTLNTKQKKAIIKMARDIKHIENNLSDCKLMLEHLIATQDDRQLSRSCLSCIKYQDPHFQQ